MNILLCAATQMELTQVMSDHHQIDYLVTGAGSPSTCYHLTRQFSNRLPALAIQIGIAGTYDENLPLGSVIQVRSDLFSDLGAQDAMGNFIPLSQLVTQDSPFGLDRLLPSRRLVVDHLVEVDGITVNTVRGHLSDILKVKQSGFEGIETMEGAAFFATCMAFDIPCIQLRAISNRVEPRNREAWQIPLALNNIHQAVKQFIKQLA